MKKLIAAVALSIALGFALAIPSARAVQVTQPLSGKLFPQSVEDFNSLGADTALVATTDTTILTDASQTLKSTLNGEWSGIYTADVFIHNTTATSGVCAAEIYDATLTAALVVGQVAVGASSATNADAEIHLTSVFLYNGATSHKIELHIECPMAATVKDANTTFYTGTASTNLTVVFLPI